MPVPYPNTADAEVAVESLELAAEGIEVDDTEAVAVTGSRKYGDITLKRGLTADSDTMHGDDLAASDGGAGVEPSEQPAVGEPEVEPDALGQASADADAGDGQADVVTAGGTGARGLGPEQDDGVDDVFEIADAKDVGERGS